MCSDLASAALPGAATARALPRFVAVGDILTDLIRSGPSQWLSRPGGAGWNVARAMARLGVAAACAGAISNDYFGDELWQASAASGLGRRFLQRSPREPLLAVVHRTDPPDYFFVGANSADLAFEPEFLPPGWMETVRWAHFGCISLTREPLAGRLFALAEKLSARGVRIAFDPNFRQPMAHMAGGYAATLNRMAALADLIKVSDEDAHALFGSDDAETVLARLRGLNPSATVLLTRGAAEATLLADAASYSARPPAVAVADTVGAGEALLHKSGRGRGR